MRRRRRSRTILTACLSSIISPVVDHGGGQWDPASMLSTWRHKVALWLLETTDAKSTRQSPLSHLKPKANFPMT